MRLVRGRVGSVSADRDVTRSLVETAAAGERCLRVWQPPKHVAFGRRDANREGYQRAREAVARRGYDSVERSTGGHAVAFTGTTVALALAEPTDDARTGIQDRYGRVLAAVSAALADLGVTAEEGEPEGAFCPGTHSLSADGKLVGLAQRVHSEAALTSALVVVADHREIADVLEPVYDALAIRFEREAVGSVARAGGDATPETVVETLERHLSEGSTTVREL